MIEVGRLMVKTAGRDSGKRGLIIDVVDDNYVLIDGQTRRKKCNINHLEPLNKVVKIKKNATHEDVVKELKKLGVEVKEKVKKDKKANKSKKKVSKETKKD